MLSVSTSAASRAPERGPLLTRAQLAVVILAVLAAIACVAALVNVLPPALRASAPEVPVRAYLQAVVAGDVTKAVRLGGIQRSADDTLLTDAAYRRASDRVTSFSDLDATVSGDTADVRVVIHQGTVSYPAQFVVQRPRGIPGLTPWHLQKQQLPSLRAEVDGPAALTVTVDGAEVTARNNAVDAVVFPGTYSVRAADGGVVTAQPAAVTTTFAGTSAPAVLTARLQPAVVSTVRSDVDAWLTRCAASSELRPEGCPFTAVPEDGVTYSDGVWAIQSRPAIAEGSWNAQLGGWPVASTSEGFVSFCAHATQGGLSGTATTGSQPFRVVGTAVADPGGGIRFVPSPAYSADAAESPTV